MRVPASGVGVPPVLNVAFDELPAGGADQVAAIDVRSREAQGHHVLELVTESERAARLIVRGAGPEPARQRLVEQPPVHQDVERIVRRVDLDRAENVLPGTLDLLERCERGGDRTVLPDQAECGFTVVALPEQEDHLPRLAGLELDRGVQRGAGIEAGAEGVRQHAASERGRPRDRTVTAEELHPIAGRGAQTAGVCERHALRETPGCRDSGPAPPTTRRRIRSSPAAARGVAGAQGPLVVAEDGEPSRSTALVRQRQQREPHRLRACTKIASSCRMPCSRWT